MAEKNTRSLSLPYKIISGKSKMKFKNWCRHMRIEFKTLIFKCKELLVKYKELIRYGIFGVLTTAVDYGVYTVLYKLFDVNDTLANAIGWFAAVIFAFITNKIFVFGSKTTKLSSIIYEFGTFFAARIVTGVVYIGGYPILTDKLGINGFLAKAILSVFNIVVNYIFSKLITFREKNDDETDDTCNSEKKAMAGVKNGSVVIGGMNKDKDGENE